jgi:hypothetical protein
MLQIVGGQIGGRSIELLHRGCICPPTQRQTQDARASTVRFANNTKSMMQKKIARMFADLLVPASGILSIQFFPAFITRNDKYGRVSFHHPVD